MAIFVIQLKSFPTRIHAISNLANSRRTQANSTNGNLFSFLVDKWVGRALTDRYAVLIDRLFQARIYLKNRSSTEHIMVCMASRNTPTPHPSTAGDLGGRALEGAVFVGLMIPLLQHILWLILIDAPFISEFLTQPPNAWMFIAVLGVLPPLLFVVGVAQATVEIGAAGGVAYVLMVIASQSLFGHPLLAVLTIIGLTLGLFVFLALKVAMNSGGRRRMGRGGMRR
jgi:hypothetical protein